MSIRSTRFPARLPVSAFVVCVLSSSSLLWLSYAPPIIGLGTRSRGGPPWPPAAPMSPGLQPRDGQPQVEASYARPAPSFEENRGQTDPRVKFLARGRDYTLFLTATDTYVVRPPRRPAGRHKGQSADGEIPAPSESEGRTALAGTASASASGIRLRMLGSNPEPRVRGTGLLPGQSNYFIGNDPREWRTGIANYGGVHYRDVYPGIDLSYYGSEGNLEYDFVVSPGADPSAIAFQVDGLDGETTVPGNLDAHGNLVFGGDQEGLRLKRPYAYQKIDGRKREVASSYVLQGEGKVGFRVGAYDTRRPLIVDPLVLSYSTYLGGSPGPGILTGHDSGQAVAVDASGSVYIAGFTGSSNFPLFNTAQGGLRGQWDVFVTKLNPAGSALVYSTYIGGSDTDGAFGLTVDAAGSAYVVGDTNSTNYPTVNALQNVLRGPALGPEDAIVTKLSPAGSALVYSTYLGGTSGDSAVGIGVDSAGNAYVTGNTRSADLPRRNGVQLNYAGNEDAYVAGLTQDGSALNFLTYLGGSGRDTGYTLRVDANGNLYVAGETSSIDFPTVRPLQGAHGGASDAWVAKFNGSGVPLYVTYLGGSGDELGRGIAADGSGNAYVTGSTSSRNFPTVRPFQAAFAGGSSDAFVSRLNPDGSALDYSTYLGGGDGDSAEEIVVDGSGSARVVGWTSSRDFPVADAYQNSYNGAIDGFMTRLAADGSSTVYSTFLGGAGVDRVYGVAVDASGNTYVAGETASTDFPVRAALVPVYRGGPYDAFLTKLSFSSSLSDPQVAVFPQIADGVVSGTTRYAAEIEIQNPGSTDFTATVQFYDASGQPVSFSMGLVGRTQETRSQFQFPVPAGTLQVLRGGSGTYPARAGWARIGMGLNGQASVTYSVVPLAGKQGVTPAALEKLAPTPFTQVTVLPAPRYSQLAIPITQDLGGARLGFAVANNSEASITGTATVYSDGALPMGTIPLQIGPLGQIVKFVDEAVSLPANFRGSLRIVWSGSVSGYAVGLMLYPNGILAAVPVIETGSSSTQEVDIFPHTADGAIFGGSYVAQIVMVNGDTRPITATVEIVGDNGMPAPLTLEVVGVFAAATRDSFRVIVPANTTRILRGGQTSLPARSGWIRLSHDSVFFGSQVDFLVMPATGPRVPLTQVSVQKSQLPGESKSRSLPILQDSGGRLGFAVVNGSFQSISGTASVQDDTGRPVGSFPLSLAPGARLIDFIDQRMVLPEDFRGRLILNWPNLGAPTFDQAGYAVGLVQYPNGVLAAVP